MAYCPNCGREGNNFCSFCGSALIFESQDTPIRQDIAQKPNVFLAILCLLCFVAGIIIFIAHIRKPVSAVYLKYSGISALIYIATIIGLAFIPF